MFGTGPLKKAGRGKKPKQSLSLWSVVGTVAVKRLKRITGTGHENYNELRVDSTEL